MHHPLLQFISVAPKIEPFQFAKGLQNGGRARIVCTASLGDLPIT